MSEPASAATRREGVLSVIGLVVGCHLLAGFLVVGFLAPVLPLVLAGVTAVSPRTRPFAVGSAAGALAGLVFIVTYGISQSL